MLFSLSLSQTTNFTLCQTESFQTTISDLKKWKNILRKGKKTVGKKGKLLAKAISPFSTVFSKDLYCRYFKTRACLGKS